MFSYLTNLWKITKNNRFNPVPVRRSRPQIEALEDRLVMSAQPVIWQTLTETSDYSDNRANAQPVKIAPMMESQILGNLSSAGDTDLFKVHLEKGQILTADANFPGSNFLPMITLSNSAGTVVAKNWSTTGSEQGVGYQVTEGGDYFIAMNRDNLLIKDSIRSSNYTLQLRSIGLAGADLDPNLLQNEAGGLYVWLDGDKLNLSGSTGHGFQLRANWVQTTVPNSPGQFQSTYQTWDNLVYIQLQGGGEIPIYNGDYGMSLTNRASEFGAYYGELTTQSFWASTDIVRGIARKFDPETTFGLKLSPGNMPVTLGEIGLKLGSDPVIQQMGVPVNPAAPYLYISGVAGLTGELLSGVSFNVGSILFDPGDPAIFLASDVLGLGVGLSYHGLIPFKAEQELTQHKGELFGNVWVGGSFDLMAFDLPLIVKGDIVLSINADHTQSLNLDTSAISKAFSLFGSSLPSSIPVEIPAWWQNIQLGVNGKLDVHTDIWNGVFGKIDPTGRGYWWSDNKITGKIIDLLPDSLSLTGGDLAHASLIYDGVREGVYFHGSTPNVFAGGPLDALSSFNTYIDVDAAIVGGGHGHFFLDAKGQFGAAGLPVQGRVLLANNFDLTHSRADLIDPSNILNPAQYITTTGCYLEAGVTVLGTGMTLRGRMSNTGAWELSATAAVNLDSLASASAVVKLTYAPATGLTFTADLNGTVNTGEVKGTVSVHFILGSDTNHHLTYSGSGTAKIKAYGPSFTWRGVTWGWIDLGSVNIGVNNDSFWFSALGKKHSFSLPH